MQLLCRKIESHCSLSFQQCVSPSSRFLQCYTISDERENVGESLPVVIGALVSATMVAPLGQVVKTGSSPVEEGELVDIWAEEVVIQGSPKSKEKVVIVEQGAGNGTVLLPKMTPPGTRVRTSPFASVIVWEPVPTGYEDPSITTPEGIAVGLGVFAPAGSRVKVRPSVVMIVGVEIVGKVILSEPTIIPLAS